MSAQRMDNKNSPTHALSEKASMPYLKIPIPSRPTTPEVSDSEETAAMGSPLPDDENISPKARTSSSSTTAFIFDKNAKMAAGDNETKKAQMLVIRFSELCNSPPTNLTVPTSLPPRAYHNWYDSEDQPEDTAPNLNLSDSGLDNKDVGVNDRDNDQTKKAQKMPVISLSEFCNSSPTKFTVPSSPPYPRAYLWYDASDRPKEAKTVPTNVSDTPPRGDNTTLEDSLLDSYLLWQSDTTDAAPRTPRSPSSDYSLNDEEDSDDDDWNDSLPGPYGAEDFIECLYDAYYLDEDMTPKIVR